MRDLAWAAETGPSWGAWRVEGWGEVLAWEWALDWEEEKDVVWGLEWEGARAAVWADQCLG